MYASFKEYTMDTQRIVASRSKIRATPFHSVAISAAYLIFLGLAVTATNAIAQNPPQTPNGQYQIERAKCFNGKSNEDRATCLTEANAAFAANKKGKLSVSDAQYQNNAVFRCQALPAADRVDCERRMHGEGTVSGSAETGGIFRELEVQTPVTPKPTSAHSENLK
jgi:hypothetical protein